MHVKYSYLDRQFAEVEHIFSDLRALVADRMTPIASGPAANPLAALPVSPPVRSAARRPAPAGHLN